MIPSGLRTSQAIIASLGFSQDIVSLLGISQGTPGYSEAVGAQDTPKHYEASRPSALRPLESLPGQVRRSAFVFRQWRRSGRDTQAQGHGALARVGVVTLAVPGDPGSAPLAALHLTPGSSPRAPEAVAAPTLTQRRAPKSRSSWCQPPARCPSVSRDSEAQKFAAPPRPGRPASRCAGAVGLGAGTPGSAVPRPSRTGLGPAPRRSQAPPSWRSATKPLPPRSAQPNSALVKAQCAGAEPHSAAASGLAPYCACTGLGGGTFWRVWRVAERFLMFPLDLAKPVLWFARAQFRGVVLDS